MKNEPAGLHTPEEAMASGREQSIRKAPFSEKSGQVLPLLVTPAGENVDLAAWISTHKEQFEEELVKHGGILFRGFGVDTVEKFSQFTKCFNTDPLPYMFRSSPRSELNENIRNIYTSTIYPNERTINMHNESSYSRVWGRKIVFCCLVPAQEGGETPIADSRRVLADISPALVAKFRAKGVKYRRNLFPDLGMPWQEVFQTNDIEVAKEICHKNKISYEFPEQDQMIIEWTKPAVYNHPVSGDETWFNHVYFFNKYSRYEELGLEADDFLPSEYLTSDTFFGDGTEISFEEYQEIGNAYKKNLVVFPYQKGDIIFLDNMLAAHGRNPYKGDRTIATAIMEAAYDTESHSL
ncbi:TauD/TfdA family dioxygenase [Chitinophaga varians]|uniref:TauD/TfdA family dioxygenase n=1 Tax=Chitinophaga varians TaxID=2202339 RepID=UPI00165F0B3C|nr:TauD/TfdA family dioxygenase [Chitinophaga varians]MBC9912779.1 TauD/TfdA family dioxygenase [Chitinophaga varians]